MLTVDFARLGLDCMEHWYGLPESLFADRSIQDYPPNYNYADEQHRFGEAGRLWRQAAPPGSAKWNAVMVWVSKSMVNWPVTLVLLGLRSVPCPSVPEKS